MRKIFYIILIFIFEFIYSCSSDKLTDIPIIDPGHLIEKKMMLSEIADDISYIPLSNAILFKGIVSLELTNDAIFISPILESLLKYNWKGDLVSMIGRRGHGPGEYKYSFLFSLDHDHHMVYILDNNKILKYSMDNHFMDEILLRRNEFYYITYSKNKLFLYEGIMTGEGKYDWLITDTLGNVLSEKVNPIEKFPSYHFCIGSKQEAFNNTLYYWNQVNDTIFKIQDENYQPIFLFANGQFRFPKQKVMDITPYFFADKIYFTKNYLFFTYRYRGFNCTGIYTKSDQQFYEVNKTKDKMAVFGPGIINDLDGGLPLIPKSYYCSKNKDEFLIGEVNPFLLKTYVESDAFKYSTPKFPEKKNELKKLANNLNENDNQVLMLVKLKE